MNVLCTLLLPSPVDLRWGRLSKLLVAAVLATLFSGSVATALPVPAGVGLTDPTLAFGLSGINDWSTEMPFLDLMKDSRPWIGHGDGVWSAMDYQTLQADGYLDANGWVKEIPPGVTSVGTVWAWGSSDSGPAAASRAGTYVLNYQGKGTLQLWGDVKVLSSEPGHIVFENVHGEAMFFNITSTDPNGTGDYIRDISVVNQKYEALYQAGEIFNPDWLSVVNDARELRFMNWMNANSNIGMVDWSDRSHVSDVTWQSNGGAPVEVMVALANQTGADPWFNMPVGATADYIRQFATYVKDHLNPGLVAHVEYANEAWNGALPAYQQMVQGAEAAWGVNAPLDYYAMKVTQMGEIWDQVFGTQEASRVDVVMGTQTANAGIAGEEMTAPVWQAHDPSGYVSPSSVVNSLAVTTYFGYGVVADADLRTQLLNVISTESPADAMIWLATKLQDPSYDSSIPQVEAQWAANKALADKYGLNLVAYEGGQHVQQAFAISGISDADMATLTNFLTAFVRSPQMADLYNQLWSAWAQIGNGPFMQFGDVEAPSKWGSWGLLSAIGDSNPRAAALFAHNAANSSWFGNGGGTQYQQGVIQIADNAGDTLTGTLKDDYLIGGSGNDTFIPGTGHDGINGGAGIDTVVLSGNASDYTLVHEGDGYRLTGPNTSDYILNVEDFKFDNNVTLSLDQMLKQ